MYTYNCYHCKESLIEENAWFPRFFEIIDYYIRVENYIGPLTWEMVVPFAFCKECADKEEYDMYRFEETKEFYNQKFLARANAEKNNRFREQEIKIFIPTGERVWLPVMEKEKIENNIRLGNEFPTGTMELADEEEYIDEDECLKRILEGNEAEYEEEYLKGMEYTKKVKVYNGGTYDGYMPLTSNTEQDIKRRKVSADFPKKNKKVAAAKAEEQAA